MVCTAVPPGEKKAFSPNSCGRRFKCLKLTLILENGTAAYFFDEKKILFLQSSY